MKSWRAWTTGEMRLMKQAFGEGLSTAEVADQLGRSLESVREQARHHGVAIRKMRQEGVERARASTVEAFLAKQIDAPEAAQRCGLSVRGFYAMLARQGISWDKYRDFYTVTVEQERRAFCLRLDEGLSDRRIGERLGLPTSVVRKARLRYARRLRGELEPTRLEAAAP